MRRPPFGGRAGHPIRCPSGVPQSGVEGDYSSLVAKCLPTVSAWRKRACRVGACGRQRHAALSRRGGRRRPLVNRPPPTWRRRMQDGDPRRAASATRPRARPTVCHAGSSPVRHVAWTPGRRPTACDASPPRILSLASAPRLPRLIVAGRRLGCAPGRLPRRAALS